MIISMFTAAIVRGTIGSVLLVPSVGVATAQHGGGHTGGMGGIGGMGGFGWWPLIWTLILLTVIILIGYGVYIYGRPHDIGRDQSDDALGTLRSRYARGELSDEEFEERRRRLEE